MSRSSCHGGSCLGRCGFDGATASPGGAACGHEREPRLQPPVGSTDRATVALGHPMGCEVGLRQFRHSTNESPHFVAAQMPSSLEIRKKAWSNPRWTPGCVARWCRNAANQRVRRQEAFTGQPAVMGREETGLGLQAPGGLEEEVLRILRSIRSAPDIARNRRLVRCTPA